MRIGVSAMFPFRPHPEHVAYLAANLKKAGHVVHYLDCPGSLSTCYNLMSKRSNKVKECAKCIAGGLYSYDRQNVTFIKPWAKADLAKDRLFKMSQSSAYTLTRIEDPASCKEPEIIAIQEKLYEPMNVVYENARRWIQDNQLEAVLFFNGRMDMTRAILEACEDLRVPYASIERTWFGHGVHFIPGANCLGLEQLHRLGVNYRDKPLTKEQAMHSASLIASRFKKENHLEWRAYNLDSVHAEWPITDRPRVLILPSSKNEQLSHPDWENPWDDYPKIFTDVLNKLGIPLRNAVLRAHPNWGERIWKTTGDKIESYYRDWCKKSGIYYIESTEKANTTGLIQQADLVLLNGSSAAYEAGLLGKQVLCVSKCHYKEAGFAPVLTTEKELAEFNAGKMKTDQDEIIRKTLRFVYVFADRFAVFKDSIRAVTTTSYRYADLLDTSRIIKMLKEQRTIPDDEGFAPDTRGEDEVVQLLKEHRWEEIKSPRPAAPAKAPDLKTFDRRLTFRWVDRVRNLSPRGDLA